MTTVVRNDAVPDAIVRTLGALIRRARMVVALRGAMATLATAVLAVLAIMAIDYWVVIFSDAARWALSMSGLALTAAVAGWFLVRPLARTFTLAGVARLIESRHPELHERISSTVELMTTPDGPELRGSDELIAALAAEAVADVGAVRPAGEVHLAAAAPYLTAAGVVLAVLAGVVAIWPAQARRLLQRALLANVSRVSQTALEVTRISAPQLKPGSAHGVDYVMLAGRRLTVELTVSDPAVTEARLRKGPLAGGPESVLAMTRLTDGPDSRRRFSITCAPATVGAFRFRLHAGDALTRYYAVRVVRQPAVDAIEVRYEYPAYTGREAKVDRSPEGSIAAVAGTTATITVRAGKPVARAAFQLGGVERPGQVVPASDGGSAWAFEVQLTQGLKTHWSARLTDEYGFVNEPADRAVRALPDKRPSVKLLAPEVKRLQLKRTERVPVAYRLTDDFGLASAELCVEVDGEAQPAMPLATPTGEGPVRRTEGGVLLDLAALPVEGARQVIFRVRATDALPPELDGPQEGFSELVTIQLDDDAPGYAEQIALAEELRLREMLTKVLAELTEAKKDSGPLRQMVPKAKALTEAVVERADRVRRRLDSAHGMLRGSIEETARGVFARLTEKLTVLTNEHVGKALDLAAQIKLADKPAVRAQLADETDFQVDRSVALVKELLEELGLMKDQLALALELQDLAARQEELADELAEMQADPNEPAAGQDQAPPADPVDPAEWRKAQEQVADELAELARRTPGAVEAQLQQDKQQAKDMVAEARQLAKEQQQLTAETERAAQTAKIDRALEDLARKQQDLAKQASDTEGAAPQAKPMSEAADDIEAGRLEEAVNKQREAQEQLDKQAHQAAKDETLHDLAERAKQLADQQDSLAKDAKAPKEALDTARAQTAEARKQIAESVKRLARTEADLAQKARDLQQAQQALANEAKALQKSAAANPPTAKAAAKTQPAEEMAQAARAAGQGQVPEAATRAHNAQRQAEGLAQDLERAAKAAAAAPKDKRNDDQARAADAATKQAKQIAEKQKDLAEQFARADAAARAERSRERQQASEATGQLKRGEQQTQQARQKAAQLAGRQQDLANKASDLARQAEKAGEKGKQAAQQHSPAGEMKRAAQAMRASDPDKSAGESAQAAEKARQFARALGADEGEPKAQSAQLKPLAQKQDDIRAQTQRLRDERRRLQQSPDRKELARLQKEQAQLADEAAALSDRVKKQAPQNDRIDTQAARSAKEASEQLAAGEASQAASSAADAGEKLSEMGQRLSAEAGRKPDGGSKEPSSGGQATGSTAQEPDQVGDPAGRAAAQTAALADAAGELGRRQSSVARQIGALAKSDPTEMAAAKQADLAERTSGLAQDVGRIAEHAQELIPQDSARQDAAEAGRQFDRAQAAQAQASQALAAGKPEQATRPEQAGASALSSAAAALERLGRKLASAAAANQSDQPAEESEDLAGAYAAADQAAESQQPSDAAVAAEQLSALAAGAMARAQAMGMAADQMSPAQMAKMASQAALTIDSKFGTGEQMTDLSAAKLAEMGITLEDWARLPGTLRDQVLQAVAAEGPEEYRGLIRRYFREIARRGGGDGADSGGTEDR